MLGEFYSRILGPMSELIHFLVSPSIIRRRRNTTLAAAATTRTTDENVQKFRRNTKFYLSGIDNHRRKLLESHRALLGLYSDHPVSTTSAELNRANMLHETSPMMKAKQVQQQSCSCLKRVFFCGYEKVKEEEKQHQQKTLASWKRNL